jgi:hypothetical protein
MRDEPRAPRKGDRVFVRTLDEGGTVVQRRKDSVTIRFDTGSLGVWNVNFVQRVKNKLG